MTLIAAIVRVRQNGADTIVKIGEPAVLPLISALADADWRVRQGAAYALALIGDARAVGPLIAALKDSQRRRQQIAFDMFESELGVQQTAFEALVRIGRPSVEPLINALANFDNSLSGFGPTLKAGAESPFGSHGRSGDSLPCGGIEEPGAWSPVRHNQ